MNPPNDPSKPEDILQRALVASQQQPEASVSSNPPVIPSNPVPSALVQLRLQHLVHQSQQQEEQQRQQQQQQQRQQDLLTLALVQQRQQQQHQQLLLQAVQPPLLGGLPTSATADPLTHALLLQRIRSEQALNQQLSWLQPQSSSLLSSLSQQHAAAAARSPLLTECSTSHRSGSITTGSQQQQQHQSTVRVDAATLARHEQIISQIGGSIQGTPDVHVYTDCSRLYVRHSTLAEVQFQRSHPPFPVKLHTLLSQADPEIIRWLPHGRAFLICDKHRFLSEVVPQYFRISSLASLTRQLHLYGFRRLTHPQACDRHAVYHELFVRGRPELAWFLQRVGLSKHPVHRCRGGGVVVVTPEVYGTQGPDFIKMAALPDENVVFVSDGWKKCVCGKLHYGEFASQHCQNMEGGMRVHVVERLALGGLQSMYSKCLD